MRPVLAVLFAALCFSTTGTALVLADVDGSPLSIGAARVLLGGGILGVTALVARARRGPATRAPATSRVPAWLVVGIGALGVLGYQPTFFTGTQLNGVAVGTVVALGSAPIMTGVLDALIRRRLPSLLWAVATVVAVAGVILVSGVVGSGGLSGANPLGILASAAAGASYAVYAIAGKVLLDRGWTPSGSMGGIFGTAAVVSIPILLTTSTAWLFTPEGLALALWLGVVTTAVAYLLFAWGLERLAPTTVATLTLAEPLAATLLGVFVLHEQLTAASVVGLLAIAAGLTLLSIPPRRRASDVAATT